MIEGQKTSDQNLRISNSNADGMNEKHSMTLSMSSIGPINMADLNGTKLTNRSERALWKDRSQINVLFVTHPSLIVVLPPRQTHEHWKG